MVRVVIESDYYHFTIMDENVNQMKLAYMLSIVSLNNEAPFCTTTFTSKLFIAFLDVCTREK